MVDVTVITPRTRHSPCVGICKLDEATGYCIGCARTGDEIGRWSGMSEAQRDTVWDKLPARHDTLAIGMRLLPWMADDIAVWVERSISGRLGTWVTGAPGAVAEFPCSADRDVRVEREGLIVVARARDAVFRLEVTDKVRAFEFGTGGPIVLGLPKARGSLTAAATFSPLGMDTEAVDAEHRDHTLFDMGVGRKASRFCIRTNDAELSATLNRVAGRTWGEVMHVAGTSIFAAKPHRVVQSKFARIEVFTPIPLPGQVSPAGAQTRFLPEFLASGDEQPSSIALPDYALPIATFYPGGWLS